MTEITREMLEDMVRGTEPYYTDFDHPLIKKAGRFTGGFLHKWTWKWSFENFTTQELQEIYKIIKESWND